MCFASCFDGPTFEELCGMQDVMVTLKPAGEELLVDRIDALPTSEATGEVFATPHYSTCLPVAL